MQYYWPLLPEENEGGVRIISQEINDDGRMIAMPAQVLAVFDGSHIVAGYAFHNYDKKAGVIEISGFSQIGFSKAMLWQIYSYCFDHLKCQMVVQRNSDRDTRLNKQMSRYGFKSHYIPRLRGRDHGEIVWTLTEEDWRANGFHRENKHGKVSA